MKIEVLTQQPLRVAVHFPSVQPDWVIRELTQGTLTTMVNYQGKVLNLRQARPAIFTPKSTQVEFVLAEGIAS
ncbi:hypothetical protein WDJ50_18685 (plasmid) [Deinococcus sp. VB142]|uniref:Uncharacterized protein n=1 Tax=Deinococcus sp. VB142 TaxID=3112952 RepID=A0AAU6Q8U6_9DEIO